MRRVYWRRGDPRGSSLPVLLIASRGAWRAGPPRTRTVRYRMEEERGYDCEGPLVTPCAWSAQLEAGPRTAR